MYSTGRDINKTGIDEFSGAGLLQSLEALNVVSDSLAPIIVDERFLTDFNPDNPSISLNFTFYEESGIITCSYIYHTKNNDWTQIKSCASYENRLYPQENKVTIKLRIEEQTSEVSVRINLTDFTRKTTYYAKGPIYTGLTDPVDSVTSETTITQNNSSTSSSNLPQTTSPKKSETPDTSDSFTNSSSTTSLYFSSIFIIIIPILAVSKKRKR